MYKWLSNTVNQCILHLVYFKFYTIYFYFLCLCLWSSLDASL